MVVKLFEKQRTPQRDSCSVDGVKVMTCPEHHK